MSPAATVSSPRTLAGALDALVGATEATLILAGGTDLMVEFQTGRTRPGHVVDVWRVDELRGIRAEPAGLRIGALTTCSELRASALAQEHADILVTAADEVGAEQIQARATIGGNLGTASPAADLTPVLFALEAEVRLVSKAGARSLPVTEFLTGYRKTARRPDELIESILVPTRAPGERRGFRKVGTRRAQSISKVVVAVAVTALDGVIRTLRASAGSVAERTILLPSLERELAGKAPDAAALDRAARRAASSDCTPIDDVRSTARYRREVLRRILRTLLAELLLDED